MAHTGKTEPEYQGNILADPHKFYSESVHAVAHVDKVHFAFIKNDPLVPNFCHPDVLAK